MHEESHRMNLRHGKLVADYLTCHEKSVSTCIGPLLCIRMTDEASTRLMETTIMTKLADPILQFIKSLLTLKLQSALFSPQIYHAAVAVLSPAKP